MGPITESRLYLAADSDNRAPATGELQISASRVLDRNVAARKNQRQTDTRLVHVTHSRS